MIVSLSYFNHNSFMKINIFEYQNYKKFLNVYIENKEKFGHGYRARMAEYIGCQKSYITKVLREDSKSDFSSEQAESIAQLLKLTKDEKKFFLLMLQYNRASTTSLRHHWRDQMKEVLARKLNVNENQKSNNVLTPDDHYRYYSNWLYSALRVATSIPTLNTSSALAKYFNLSNEITEEILAFLTHKGLLERQGETYRYSKQSQILLPAGHPMTIRHHSNWRVKTLQALENRNPQDFHYSYLVTISEDDSLKIRSFLVEMIKEIIQRTEPSPPESIYSLGLDFFKI